jgi:chemotaxis protein CheC
MTALSHHDRVRAGLADRLGELASIGAGHAAGALATLLGRPFEMRVPSVRVLAPDEAAPFSRDERAFSGVLFSVRGGPGGELALLLGPADREALLAALLGPGAGVAAQAESALCEVGNVVASHALSAVGDLLGETVLPSPPELALHDGAQAFARRVGARTGSGPVVSIEVELRARAGDLCALLAWVPEAIV